MIKDIFAKMKAVVSPKKDTTAEVHLTNGTIIKGETFKMGVSGAGGGGGSGRAYINRNDLCLYPGGSMAGIVYVAPAPRVAEEVNHEAPNKDTAEPTTIEHLKAENEKLRKLLRPFIYTGNIEEGFRIGQNPPPPTASEEEAWAHYGGSEFHYQQWRQWRAVKIGRELLGKEE